MQYFVTRRHVAARETAGLACRFESFGYFTGAMRCCQGVPAHITYGRVVSGRGPDG